MAEEGVRLTAETISPAMSFCRQLRTGLSGLVLATPFPTPRDVATKQNWCCPPTRWSPTDCNSQQQCPLVIKERTSPNGSIVFLNARLASRAWIITWYQADSLRGPYTPPYPRTTGEEMHNSWFYRIKNMTLGTLAVSLCGYQASKSNVGCSPCCLLVNYTYFQTPTSHTCLLNS